MIERTDENTRDLSYGDVKASPTVPTSEAREPGFVDDVREAVYDLIETVKKQTKDGSPAAQRAAAIAITHLETAMMWAVGARFL